MYLRRQFFRLERDLKNYLRHSSVTLYLIVVIHDDAGDETTQLLLFLQVLHNQSVPSNVDHLQHCISCCLVNCCYSSRLKVNRKSKGTRNFYALQFLSIFMFPRALKNKHTHTHTQ